MDIGRNSTLTTVRVLRPPIQRLQRRGTPNQPHPLPFHPPVPKKQLRPPSRLKDTSIPLDYKLQPELQKRRQPLTPVTHQGLQLCPLVQKRLRRPRLKHRIQRQPRPLLDLQRKLKRQRWLPYFHKKKLPKLVVPNKQVRIKRLK